MESLIDALVFVVQLALAGFVIWGGWLCWRHRTPAPQARPMDAPPKGRPAQDFERVVSLVLLALLFLW